MKSYRSLAERIRAGLPDVEKTIERVTRAVNAYRNSAENQDLFLDSIAIGLHDFYTGLELIFTKIATTVDGNLPGGREWHRDLLIQMSRDLETTRPAVISRETLENLDEYRRFRHVVRSVYAFNFDIERIEPLVERSNPVFLQVRRELLFFADLLDRIAGSNPES